MLGTELFFWKRAREKFAQRYASLIKERSECMSLGGSWAELQGKEKWGRLADFSGGGISFSKVIKNAGKEEKIKYFVETLYSIF